MTAEGVAAKMARVHNGPVRGTRVISIEIPPSAENFALVDSLYTACSNISKGLFPEAFITAYTILEGKGRHGGNNADIRGERNPD
jgi:hypothetical protein